MAEHGGGPEHPGGVFKTWQVFAFSLVPLVLVFMGVIIGSMPGSDAELEVFPTPPPAPPASSAPPPSSAPGTTTIQITAQNLLWSTRTLTAAPNSPVAVRLNNQDAGQLHNFAVYTNAQATTKVFVGDFQNSVGVKDYSFTAPAAGTYFYRCDTHPDTMTGTLSVR